MQKLIAEHLLSNYESLIWKKCKVACRICGLKNFSNTTILREKETGFSGRRKVYVLHNTCEVAVGFAALCKVVCCIEVLLLACNCYNAYIECDLCVFAFKLQ